MCPVDLTRTIPVETNKDATRKLAFSVENILDPNKFCSKKDKFNARHWIENYERGERERLDDDQSESQSGEHIFFDIILCVILFLNQFFGKPSVNRAFGQLQCEYKT